MGEEIEEMEKIHKHERKQTEKGMGNKQDRGKQPRVRTMCTSFSSVTPVAFLHTTQDRRGEG